MPTHPLVNVDQADGWDGEDGDYWTAHEEHYNRSLRLHSTRLHAAARISPGERVLDIGCGCGESTREAARAAAPGAVLGVDLSAHMLERARQRAREEGLANVRFEQADAQVQPFEKEAFDIGISRFGVMFFSEPITAFRNIRNALRPGGRLALLTWRALQHNEWLREFRTTLAAGRTLPVPPPCAPGPLGLSAPDATRGVLADAGFVDIAFTEVTEPIWFGDDSEEAFNFVGGFPMIRNLIAELDATAKARALDNFRATIARHATAEGVRFQSSSWIITARRE